MEATLSLRSGGFFKTFQHCSFVVASCRLIICVLSWPEAREGRNKSYFLKVTLAIAHSKKMLSRLGRPYTSSKEEEIKATPKSCFHHFIFRVGGVVCSLDSRMPTLLFESSFYFFPGGLRFWPSSVRPSLVIVSLEIVRLVWLEWSQSSTQPLACSFCFRRCVLLTQCRPKSLQFSWWHVLLVL